MHINKMIITFLHPELLILFPYPHFGQVRALLFIWLLHSLQLIKEILSNYLLIP